MNHAIVEDKTVDQAGHVTERAHHYLTCRACAIENEANNIALIVAKIARPDDWVKVKYLIEEAVKTELTRILGGPCLKPKSE